MNLISTTVVPLVVKYHPTRFDQLVGQEEAARLLGSHVSSEMPPPIILHGPPGTGKTSAARIFAKAFHCEAPTPSPCGRCRQCQVGLTPFEWHDFSGARWDEPEVAKHAEVLLRQVPWGRFGVFIDEVHAMQNRSADVLLEEVERPRRNRFFICATTELESVRPALRSRCLIVGFKPIARSKLFHLAQTICQDEGIAYQPEALDILVAQARGAARDLVMGIDSVATRGPLTPELLKSALSLDWTEDLVAYFDALLAGDLVGQLEAVKAWLALPPQKVTRIREFLLYLYNFEVSSPRILDTVNAAFYLVGAPIRQPIVAKFAQRARQAGLSAEAYWTSLLSFWLVDPATIADESALTIKLHQFHRLVTPLESPLLPDTKPPSQPQRQREYRSRSQRDSAASRLVEADGPSLFLGLKDTERLSDAAGVLGQHYGRWFNGLIDLNVSAPAAEVDLSASRVITALTHELRLRINDWSGRSAGRPFHWVYRNRRHGGVHSRIAVHIPYQHIAAAEEWLTGKEWLVEDTTTITVNARFHNPKPPNPKAREISRRIFHWRCMRELWAAVDPAILHWASDGTRKPLRELLQLKGKAEASEPMTIKLVGASHSLGAKVRASAEANKMALLSAFRDGAWGAIDSGWELLEHRDRLAESVERADQLQRVKHIGDENNELAHKRYLEELDALGAQWPDDPRNRPRTWMPWWSANQERT